MKNFRKIALGLMVGAMAIGFSAFKNAKHTKLAGTYYYNAGEQAWGSTSLDQTPANYSTYTGSPNCQSSTNICTYNLVAGKYVQATEGTFN